MDLPKTVKRRKKRVGRGYGSGKGGHTAGRGMKGQKSRRNLHILFEGLKVKKSFFKGLPLLRGKGKNHSKPTPMILSATKLNSINTKTISVQSLIKVGLVDEKKAKANGVKILGGKLKKKFDFNVPVSSSVQKQVEKLGGKVKSKDA
ncbi:uL15m family ribosomal protein [Patescibacteria group bacterium]